VHARRRLHVHALIDGLWPGGAETLLAEQAAGAAVAGFDFTVGYLHGNEGPPAERLRRLGVVPERVPISSLLGPRDLRRVRAHVARVRPDVLHTHLGYSDFLGGIAARSLGVPAVSTLHVMEWDRDLRSRVQLSLIALARLACCRRVIMVSDAARASYLAAWPARRDRVVTVHNGIAAEARAGAGGAVRAQLGIAPTDHVIAMITVLREGKGHDVAVEAIRELRGRFPDVRLLIVGDGPNRAQVHALAAPLGGAAILTGYRGDVMEILDATDVLLHPSRVDAFPTALLEAMAAGVPVVASRVGGIPEIVEDGRSGVLVEAPPRPAPVAHALGDLLADPSRRRALAAAGRARFEQHFTIEAWMLRLSVVYEAAIAGAGRRPGRPRRAGRQRAGSRTAR
jgi:glycosyltransferase involved in cell wall biosynthesis